MEISMKSFVTVGAVLALAGAAVAGPFKIGAVDVSDGTVAGGVVGTGLDFNGGTVYQDAFGTAGNTGEPNQAFIGLAPSLEFDTYLTIDHGPVEASPGYNGGLVAAASDVPGSQGFVGGGYRGAWFVAGPFVDAVDPTTDDKSWQLFVGRITLLGGSLTGRIAVGFAEPGDAAPSTIVGDLVTPEQLAAGQGIITENSVGDPLFKYYNDPSNPRGYAWVNKSFTTVIGNETYTVNDIWLQNVAIPTPGAMGLLGVAGLAAIRRRR
jgi:hypothetical protein